MQILIGVVIGLVAGVALAYIFGKKAMALKNQELAALKASAVNAANKL